MTRVTHYTPAFPLPEAPVASLFTRIIRGELPGRFVWRDERAVVTYSEPKSISRETTFAEDLHAVRDRERLSRIFTDLCVKVAGDLARKGYAGRTIGLKLRYDSFRTVTRDLTLDHPTTDAMEIRRAAGECLKRVPLDRRIRLLGVRVGSLSKKPE